MGCLPSRSTAVSPDTGSHGQRTRQTTNQWLSRKRIESGQQQRVKNHNEGTKGNTLDKTSRTSNQVDSRRRVNSTNNNKSDDDRKSNFSLNETAEDDIMSILNEDQARLMDKDNNGSRRQHKNAIDEDDDENGASSETDDGRIEQDREDKTTGARERSGHYSSRNKNADSYEDDSSSHANTPQNELDPSTANRSIDQDEEDDELALVLPESDQRVSSKKDNNSVVELDVNLLREYVIVDYEISQLEDRGALRIYHEKIEQLEQLERELDMIGQKAEEVAVRSEHSNDRMNSSRMINGQRDLRADGDSNSSGATGSISVRSSAKNLNGLPARQTNSSDRDVVLGNSAIDANKNNSINGRSIVRKGGDSGITDNNNQASPLYSNRKFNNLNYSTIEDVFNRKIILEKERDKLKKEVELVITECDRLQLRYKKRDDILDKLFDGSSGNGVENHLENQLHWLMEQKHYVDLVFFAWKRAETLTSQTCEQFAHAAELVKRLEIVKDDQRQRRDLAKDISELLIKSRQDMEQAQKYNPNVDAPFFTDSETERFERIIEIISNDTIRESDYKQISAVIQGAYKRAVSIRLWLEQILQITIAHDSFELAEEYKWIAIQLRKERIALVNSKLKKPPHDSMARELREQIAGQQQLAIMNGRAVETANTTANRVKNSNPTNSSNNNNNRDSGVESEDIDIEEEIYRLLEMNKSRLEAAISSSAPPNANEDYQKLTVSGKEQQNRNDIPIADHLSRFANDSERAQMIRDKVERQIEGEQPLASSQALFSADAASASPASDKNQAALAQNGSVEANHGSNGIPIDPSLQSASSSVATISRLKVELDEAARQSLQKQVNQVHAIHRNKMELLQGHNKAKASDSMINRMQQARSKQHDPQNEEMQLAHLA